MNYLKRVFVSFVLLCALILTAEAAPQFVNFTRGDLRLNANGQITIFISSQDERGIAHAARDLCADLQKVCGGRVELVAKAEDARIVIGTVGHVAEVACYASQLKGKREMYLIDVADHRLTIAGSDRRGTIYGIYELCRQAGVSPWHYWADVPVEHHENIFAQKGVYTDGEPAVRWRGISLNDEAPCLTSWVKNTFGTGYGDHHFYERVFDLLLRLKGNMMWPAMWGWAFYADDPDNLRLADEMGIMMSTSHHEPMARNHQEYARHRKEWGAWNYQTNQKSLDRFFREGIERMRGTDDIVTIGMRGDGDAAMGNKVDVKLMERIIANQRKIISQVTGRPAKETPQVWALYKEVQDYYDAGLRLPDDVTMLVCDDNWGNIRRVPNAQERKRKGGWGIYYHVDYVGAPRNTKWLNVTQTQQMFEQLSLGYDHGIRQMWILNVGDLKPMEYPIQLFLDMAWNPKAYTLQDVTRHTERYFEENLGAAYAREAADIFNTNCKYMARCTPEMLDHSTYNLATGEWRNVTDDYQRLEARALRLYVDIPENRRDFYRQLLLFPIQAMANLYDMYYAQAQNLQLAPKGLPEANDWADRVEACFVRDSLLCAQYNTDIAGGKWKGMMTQKHIGYTIWDDNFPHDLRPATTRVNTSAHANGGYTYGAGNGYVAIETPHYHSAHAPEGTQWTTYPYYGRTLGAVALTPYTADCGDASITYAFVLPQDAPREVTVHVIVKSTLDFLGCGGHQYAVSIDGGKEATVNFNRNLVDREPYVYSLYYPTVARRIVESKTVLPTANGTAHTLTLRPLTPGIVFEKIVIDYGGYQPQYLFGKETEANVN